MPRGARRPGNVTSMVSSSSSRAICASCSASRRASIASETRPLAALIATIVGLMACVVGGILEFVAQDYFPSDVAWGLRMLWHAGCAFGAVYCAFLQRLLRVLPP